VEPCIVLPCLHAEELLNIWILDGLDTGLRHGLREFIWRGCGKDNLVKQGIRDKPTFLREAVARTT
jgi:hypothetical protein